MAKFLYPGQIWSCLMASVLYLDQVSGFLKAMVLCLRDAYVLIVSTFHIGVLGMFVLNHSPIIIWLINLRDY